MSVNIVRALSGLFFKLDTRSSDGSVRKIIMFFISYLIPGIFIPYLIYSRNTDPTGFNYIFLCFLFYTLIISFTIVNEFDNIVITQSEADLLSVMPVNTNMIVTAKLFVLIRYLILITLPLLIPGCIFYYLLAGSVQHAFLFYFSGLHLIFFNVFILLLFYSVALKNIRMTKIGSYVLLIQLLCIIILILGYQYLSYIFAMNPKGSPGSIIKLLSSDAIRQFIPHSWFALIAVKQSFTVNYKYLLKLLLPFVIVSASYYSLRFYLLDNYMYIREKLNYSKVLYTSSKKRGWLSSLLTGIYIKEHNEAASFHLMHSLFLRDKAVRMNIIPMIMIPAGLALFAFLTEQLPDPFVQYYFGIQPVFHISVLLSFLVVINTAVLGMKINSFSDASWVYDTYPVTSRNMFINGSRKFIVIYLILPVSVLLFIIFAFSMSLFSSLLHSIFIFSCANLFNTVIHIFKKDLPFSKENTLINSLSRLTTMIYPFAFGVILVFVQSFTYISYIRFAIGLLIIILTNQLFILLFKRKDKSALMKNNAETVL